VSEQRNLTYTYVVLAIVSLIVILVVIGYSEKWTIETYVQTISPIVSALSIVFFVLDRILYEKPHFTILRSKDSPFPILDQFRAKGAAFLIQNDGLRDANSVSLVNRILTRRLKEIKSTYPEMYLIDGAQKSYSPVKVGELIIGLIPKSDFPPEGWGFMRLTIHATFGQENKFLVYNTINGRTEIHLFKSFNFILELPFLIRNYRRLIPDVYEYFTISTSKEDKLNDSYHNSK
jgi:hypothetical protein